MAADVGLEIGADIVRVCALARAGNALEVSGYGERRVAGRGPEERARGAGTSRMRSLARDPPPLPPSKLPLRFPESKTRAHLFPEASAARLPTAIRVPAFFQLIP